MTAADLLARLRAAGVDVRLTGDRLQCKPAPASDLLVELREHKAEVLALLRSERFCHICRQHTPTPCDLDAARERWTLTPCRRFAWRAVPIPCPACGGVDFWPLPDEVGGEQRCRRCCPQPGAVTPAPPEPLYGEEAR